MNSLRFIIQQQSGAVAPILVVLLLIGGIVITSQLINVQQIFRSRASEPISLELNQAQNTQCKTGVVDYISRKPCGGTFTCADGYKVEFGGSSFKVGPGGGIFTPKCDTEEKMRAEAGKVCLSHPKCDQTSITKKVLQLAANAGGKNPAKGELIVDQDELIDGRVSLSFHGYLINLQPSTSYQFKFCSNRDIFGKCSSLSEPFITDSTGRLEFDNVGLTGEHSSTVKSPSLVRGVSEEIGCGFSSPYSSCFAAYYPPVVVTVTPSPTPAVSDRLCIQVITWARNKTTGECKRYPNPCIVPTDWEQDDSCKPSFNFP